MKADSHRYPLGLIRPVIAIVAALAPAACGWVEIPASRGGSPGGLARGGGPMESASSGAATASRSGTPRPADGTVTVASGDTVYAFSRRYGVSMQAIIDANNLPPPFHLRIGQKLILPEGIPSAGASAASSPTVVSSSGASMGPVPTGDPSRSGVRVSELPPMEGAPSPASQPGAPTTASREDMVPAPESERQASLAPNPAVPPPSSGSGFMWPVNGDVIAEFGPQEKGRHNDGINIAAPRGTPVRAVESGVVAYAGNELRGFGNLLLVKHESGWVSAYAHNADLLVQRGDTVSRGQTIARVGDSGGVPTPQLHFELRKGPRPVDPRSYLRQPVS